MHRSPVIKKKRKTSSERNSITSNIFLKIDGNDDSHQFQKKPIFKDSIDRINEAETESISSEGSYLEIGLQTSTMSMQVQDIWPQSEVAFLINNSPGHAEIISLIKREDFEAIYQFPNGPGIAVIYTSWVGDSDSLEKLLDGGTPANVLDGEGRSPLHLAAMRGNSECMKILLKHGARTDVWDRNRIAAPLHCAAASGSVDSVVSLLNAGANINIGISLIGSGKTPLHFAVQSNAVSCVRLLLNSGAIVNLPQVFTETPLHVAADHGYSECVKLLLSAGADSRVQFGHYKSTPLHLAAADGNADCAELLLQAGADVNKPNSKQQTPLHLAALSQSAKTVELLLSNKADPNAKDTDNRTPLHCAIVKGSRSNECVQILLKNGAQVNAPDKFGYTPVHTAALNDFSSCLRLLLDYGGDVTKKTNGNVSALSFISRRTPEIISYLESKLDQSISLHDHELGDIDCEINLDFRSLVPDIRSGETRLLLAFIENGQRRILRHALVQTFLHLKWRQIRKYFIFSFIIHAIYVSLCSIYILNVFLDEQENEDDAFILPISLQFLNILLWLSTMGIVLKELFQIAHDRKAYIYHWENWLQWFIIVTVFIILVPPPRNINFRNIKHHIVDFAIIQHHIAVFSIFFNWIELMVIMGRFPMFGIYVQMFTKGSIHFGKFLLAYCCLLLAFSFSFRMCFPGYKAFKDITVSVVKTIVMMSGELEYEDVFFPEEKKSLRTVSQPNDNVPFPVTAHIFYLFFILIVTTVLTNLLVGLSVSDIQGLQRSAGLDRLVRQAELVAYMESLLFSSLWNWVPSRILSIFQRSATLLGSPRRRILVIRPNDPREDRIPKELISAVYRNLAGRKPNRKERNRKDSDYGIRKEHYKCCRDH